MYSAIVSNIYSLLYVMLRNSVDRYIPWVSMHVQDGECVRVTCRQHVGQTWRTRAMYAVRVGDIPHKVIINIEEMVICLSMAISIYYTLI
jgi:hypothetical protein